MPSQTHPTKLNSCTPNTCTPNTRTRNTRINAIANKRNPSQRGNDASTGWSRRQLLGGVALFLATTATGVAALTRDPDAAADTARILDWDDGMQIRLSTDSVFRIDESAGERRLHLFRGKGEIITEAPAGLHGALQPRLVVVTAEGEWMPLGGHCTVACGVGGGTFKVNAVMVRAGGEASHA